MDTKPIFKFLNELESRKRYDELAEHDTSREAFYIYGMVLTDLQKEFEECVFQCIAENSAFKSQLQIIANRLEEIVLDSCTIKKVSPKLYNDSYEATFHIAMSSLLHLQENYGIRVEKIWETEYVPKPLGVQERLNEPEPQQETKSKPSVAPHFKGLNITIEQAERLYDKLIDGRLEDTGKADFVYYFTGKGEQPTKKLKWNGDAIFLSILMEKLTTNTIPWTMMDKVFDGLNVDSMKSNLSKERRRGSEAYSRNAGMIGLWLGTKK